MKDFEFESEDDVVLEDEEEIELKRPSMYRVMIHNDAYTPREFVVLVLQSIFHKSEEEGQKIMLEAHTKGIATVGIYTYEIATTNVYLVEQLSDEYGYPLRCTMEEVEI